MGTVSSSSGWRSEPFAELRLRAGCNAHFAAALAPSRSILRCFTRSHQTDFLGISSPANSLAACWICSGSSQKPLESVGLKTCAKMWHEYQKGSQAVLALADIFWPDCGRAGGKCQTQTLRTF